MYKNYVYLKKSNVSLV
ncbi:hypothetical protein Avbf_17133 [Armadillidium vulgare]|nr:hypothetical protein Avbf_17133 [Armadillidium vulgare]